MKTIEEKIENISIVEKTNLWEKADKKRLYIDFKSQNRFSATGMGRVYIDLVTNELHENIEKKECAGAKTFYAIKNSIDEIKELIK